MAPFSLPDSLVVGSRVAVQCVLDKGDPPVLLEWMHDDRPATELQGVSVTPLGQYVLALVIEEVRTQHAGNYTCKASGRSGNGVIDAVHSSMLFVHGTFYGVLKHLTFPFVETQRMCTNKYFHFHVHFFQEISYRN